MILREYVLGLSPEDIAINHSEYSAEQIARIVRGKTFKLAVAKMQEDIDQELIESMAEDPVRKYMQGKALPMAKVLVEVAESEDANESARVRAADSLLSKTGYASAQETSSVPVIVISSAKEAALVKVDVLDTIPDVVDGEDGWISQT